MVADKAILWTPGHRDHRGPGRHAGRRHTGRPCRRAGPILKRPRQCLVERAGRDAASV